VARIVVYAMAYRGDVYPYVPIASELARRGHAVVFVVPREFHGDMAAEPFRCAHSGTDFGPGALDRRAAYVDRWGNRLGGALLLRLYFGEFTVPHLDALYAAVDAEVARADLLISHPAASLVGAMAAERRGVPWLVGDLFPTLVPSEHAPVGGLPYLGRRPTRALLRAARSRLLDPVTVAAPFRAYRHRLGLPVPDGWNVIDARLSPHANVALVPSAYTPPAPDWPQPYRLVGFTPWSGPGGGALDAEVERYLDGGDPPVVVTLGTSAASARPEVFDQALDALDRLGGRAIVLASNDAQAGRLSARGGGHLVRRFVPLAPLLPRSAAIVHSGAHGTNSLALLAGVPSVVVPCLFDQVAHARRQEALGTGVHVRRRRPLAPALGRVLGDDAMRARAQEFAALIAHEDGTTATADEAERMVA